MPRRNRHGSSSAGVPTAPRHHEDFVGPAQLAFSRRSRRSSSVSAVVGRSWRPPWSASAWRIRCGTLRGARPAARPADGSPASGRPRGRAEPRAHAARRGTSSVLPQRLPSWSFGHDRRSPSRWGFSLTLPTSQPESRVRKQARGVWSVRKSPLGHCGGCPLGIQARGHTANGVPVRPLHEYDRSRRGPRHGCLVHPRTRRSGRPDERRSSQGSRTRSTPLIPPSPGDRRTRAGANYERSPDTARCWWPLVVLMVSAVVRHDHSADLP
jgi:hypothetical protein